MMEVIPAAMLRVARRAVKKSTVFIVDELLQVMKEGKQSVLYAWAPIRLMYEVLIFRVQEKL